ncbi:MAG: hypothetical protein ACK5V4_07705 [Alphaproteobacteria bacterium]
MSDGFKEYLIARDAEIDDDSIIKNRNNALIPEEKHKSLDIIITRLKSEDEHMDYTSLEYEEFIKEFNALPDPKINALYYRNGTPQSVTVSSILGTLLQNPTDTNLQIFHYLLAQYPAIEFHKAIDIRSAGFDTQRYMKDESLRDNAQKMLSTINEKASQEDKNKLGLVNLAIFYDHLELFKKLVDNPETSLELTGERRTPAFDSLFMHPERAGLREYFLSHPTLLSRIASFRGDLLYQMTVSCSSEELKFIFAKIANHTSFQESVGQVFSLDFSTIIVALDGKFVSKDELDSVVAMYKFMLSDANVLLDFSAKFASEYVDVLANHFNNTFGLAQIYKRDSLSAEAINEAIFSIIDLMLIYQPQLIDSDPVTQVYADKKDIYGLFFKLVLKEDDQEFLKKIFKDNTHIDQYLDKFFDLDLKEQRLMLFNAGIDTPQKFSKVMGNFPAEKYKGKINDLNNEMLYLFISSAQQDFKTSSVVELDFKKQLRSFLKLGILDQYDILEKIGIDRLDNIASNTQAILGSDSPLLASFKEVAELVKSHADGVNVSVGLDIRAVLLILKDARSEYATDIQKELARSAFLANPQLIKEFFGEELKAGQDFSMFFRDVRQMRNNDKLASLFNQNTKAFVEEFLKKDLNEQKKIIEASGVRDQSDLNWLTHNLQYIGAGVNTDNFSVNVTAQLNILAPEISKDLPKDYENRGFFYKVYEWWNGLKPSRHQSPSIEGSLLNSSDNLTAYIEELSKNKSISRTAEFEQLHEVKKEVFEIKFVAELSEDTHVQDKHHISDLAEDRAKQSTQKNSR